MPTSEVPRISDDGAALRVEHELFVRSFFEVRPPDRMVQQLSASLQDVFFAAGTTLYQQGESANKMYFIIRGEVALESENEEAWVFGAQSLLGAIDAGQRRPYSRTARARSEVAALTMAFRDYVDLMEDYFDFTKNSVEFNCRSLHERSLQLAPDHVFPPLARRDPLLPLHPLTTELMDRVLVLSRCDLFSNTPVQALVTLAKHVETERWGAGDTLFRDGDPAPHVRLVAVGTLRAQRLTPVVDARFGPGDLLLRQAALGIQSHSYTVIAETAAITLRLLAEDLFDIAEDHFQLIGSLFAFFGRENERTRRLLARRSSAGGSNP